MKLKICDLRMSQSFKLGILLSYTPPGPLSGYQGELLFYSKETRRPYTISLPPTTPPPPSPTRRTTTNVLSVGQINLNQFGKRLWKFTSVLLWCSNSSVQSSDDDGACIASWWHDKKTSVLLCCYCYVEVLCFIESCW